MARETGVRGIRVNTLVPGYIWTAMTDELFPAKPVMEKIWMRGSLLGKWSVPKHFQPPAVTLLAKWSSSMTGTNLRLGRGHCAFAGATGI